MGEARYEGIIGIILSNKLILGSPKMPNKLQVLKNVVVFFVYVYTFGPTLIPRPLLLHICVHVNKETTILDKTENDHVNFDVTLMD